MKTLLDFLPVLLFFIAYKVQDIYFATAVLMGATVIQMGVIYFIDKKLQILHKVTLALILVFGSMTLILHDDRFIKWKPTILYAVMAIALAAAIWIYRKDILQTILGSHIVLPQKIWHRLNVAWVFYCIFMASINAYVVVMYTTEQWVNFKVWGYVFPLAFLIGQGLYIAPHIREIQNPSEKEESS